MSDDDKPEIRHLDSKQPIELSAICLEAGISYDRVASVEVSATGDICVGVMHRFSLPSPGRALRVPFRETNFLQSVACEGRFIFFEATKALWELKVLPELLDMLARIKPPHGQRGVESRNMLFATPTVGEIQQFVFEPANEAPRIGHLSLPGSTMIRSVRALLEFGVLVGIATDVRGFSSIVAIPRAELSLDRATDPGSWRRVALQPSTPMRQLSCPVVVRDSSGTLRATFMVSLMDGKEVSLVLVKESEKDIRAIWGDPIQADAVTVAPAATPHHVKRFRSSPSSTTIEIVDAAESERHYRPFLPS